MPGVEGSSSPHAAGAHIRANPRSMHPSVPIGLETLHRIVEAVRKGDRELPFQRLIPGVMQYIERNWVGNNVTESTASLLLVFLHSVHFQPEIDSLQAWTEFKDTDCCKALGQSINLKESYEAINIGGESNHQYQPCQDCSILCERVISSAAAGSTPGLTRTATEMPTINQNDGRRQGGLSRWFDLHRTRRTESNVADSTHNRGEVGEEQTEEQDHASDESIIIFRDFQ